jgi:hypothetical protein
MASVHWVTNRGKVEILEGRWNSAGATDIRMGYIQGTSRPTTIDTEAEIQDLNFVSELLALAGVDEPTVGGYARMNLDRVNAAEDDTNNWAALDAGDEVLSSVAAGESIIGGFVLRFVTNDSDSPLWSVWLLDAPGVATNGSNVTAAIADLYRAI